MSERPVSTERTSAQVVTMSGVGDVLYQNMPATYKTYRELRKDPTVALARALIAAAVLVGEWSLEADDDVDEEQLKFILDEVVKKRQQILEPAIMGGIDFGWQPFEIVFEPREGVGLGLRKLKPLLQDITTILIDSTTGELRGYRQKDLRGSLIDLERESVCHVAFRVEGTDWYGQSLLENVRTIVQRWLIADAGAQRYDKKVAGSRIVVYYPVGATLYNGVNTDNADIARGILNTLESSGTCSVPDEVAAFVDAQNAEKSRWRIELLKSDQQQPGFVEREKYLDALKVRGLGLPERAILEGQFGTKAEAGVHADMGLLNIQLMDQHIADAVNEQVVDLLLVLNYGPDMKGKVRIEPAPLIDDELILLKGIYNQIMTNAQGFAEEFETIDTDAIKDKLGIPKSKEVAQAGEDETPAVLAPETGNEETGDEVEASFTPRTERGRWTYDGAGLAEHYGDELQPTDDAFRSARQLANEGKFDEARSVLYRINRPRNAQAHFAVQRRMAQMLERFLRIEQQLSKKGSAV